jgi:RHS repeat-associated protein
LTDADGSIRAVTDAAGVVVRRYSYSPFGERRSVSASLLDSLGFRGERQDDDRLWAFGSRHFDATLGRFLATDRLAVEDESDPVNVTSNPYALTMHNPFFTLADLESNPEISSLEDAGFEDSAESLSAASAATESGESVPVPAAFDVPGGVRQASAAGAYPAFARGPKGKGTVYKIALDPYVTTFARGPKGKGTVYKLTSATNNAFARGPKGRGTVFRLTPYSATFARGPKGKGTVYK